MTTTTSVVVVVVVVTMKAGIMYTFIQVLVMEGHG
jgi:hypothetical protein